jgi:hypothetical protein
MELILEDWMRQPVREATRKPLVCVIHYFNGEATASFWCGDTFATHRLRGRWSQQRIKSGVSLLWPGCEILDTNWRGCSARMRQLGIDWGDPPPPTVEDWLAVFHGYSINPVVGEE